MSVAIVSPEIVWDGVVSHENVEASELVADAFGVFVSTSLGSSGGNGTKASPYSSLQTALQTAANTGKRVYAHEVEPGATDAPVVAWYGFDRTADAWTKHVIFQGEPARGAPAGGPARDAQKDFLPGTAGTGLQMTAIDIDGDGDVDLVCPGKSGLYLFENLGATP